MGVVIKTRYSDATCHPPARPLGFCLGVVVSGLSVGVGFPKGCESFDANEEWGWVVREWNETIDGFISGCIIKRFLQKFRSYVYGVLNSETIRQSSTEISRAVENFSGNDLLC